VTGDPKLDIPGVYKGFESLWDNSNYSAQTPQAERLEQGAWIVQTASGYTLVPILNATSGPCSIAISELPPPGAVSMLHTHPFRLGETTNTCAGYGAIYTGTPSAADRAALSHFGFSTGYILDASGIGRFTATGGEAAQREVRCGY
jgi:hypothetical protein